MTSVSRKKHLSRKEKEILAEATTNNWMMCNHVQYVVLLLFLFWVFLSDFVQMTVAFKEKFLQIKLTLNYAELFTLFSY